MNWHIVEGSWKQFKGRLQMFWAGLRDNQGELTAGRRLELAGRAQKSYGLSTDEAEQQIRRFHLRIKEQDGKRHS